LTELPELDNLFAAEGVIAAAQELAAKAFGADQTWFLTNGSTCGLEAAILATCLPGETILVPRNAHQSIISGLVLAGAHPVFLQPDYSGDLDLVLGMAPETVAKALTDYPESRAVLVVSPTYHGVCSDLAAIAAITHRHNIPLLVDGAHGPHFGCHPDLPAAALSQGADLVVQSTHKVLGALTQAAMLHCQGDRVDRDRLRRALQLTQSSSPSYLLLASLDAARHQLATAGEALLTTSLELAQDLHQHIEQIPNLTVFSKPQLLKYPSVADLDLTRLTIDVSDLGISGLEADDYLHHHLGVTVELAELHHLTLIISWGNTPGDIQRCHQGLTRLAARQTQAPSLRQGKRLFSQPSSSPYSRPQLSPRQAFFSPHLTLPAPQALGQVSAETIAAYPPGIPTLLAGETITSTALEQLTQLKQLGAYLSGAGDPSLETLQVLPTSPRG
jgi:arginine decarboxylase